jgi:hypothetical protein
MAIAVVWAASLATDVLQASQLCAALPERGASVHVATTCEAMVPAYCQGGFGFQLLPSGDWQAGPAPDGRIVSGRLLPSERETLSAAARRVVDSAAAANFACQARPRIPGVGASVTVTTEREALTLHGAGGRLDPGCASGNASADAELFTLADRLMRRYYPRPF